LAHLIELEWLDDRHHQLHVSNPSMFTAAGCCPGLVSSRANLKAESSRVPTPLRRGKQLEWMTLFWAKRDGQGRNGQICAYKLCKSAHVLTN
jgi:hypothetical protein